MQDQISREDFEAMKNEMKMNTCRSKAALFIASGCVGAIITLIIINYLYI